MANSDSTLTTCTGCGASCDDIALEVDDAGVILQARNACELGEQWFDVPAYGGPPNRVDGESATLEQAVQRAAQIIRRARMPLVTGLQQASTEAVRAAVELADYAGACIDWTTSPADSASTLALQTAGGVTATLGEVAQRADVVLLWASDLAETHPRHFERYSLQPTSPWLPNGRADRTLVVVDDRVTSTSGQADTFLNIAPQGHYEALVTLRSLVAEIPLDARQVHRQTGVELSVWQELAKRMRSAKFGACLYGKRLSAEGPESLITLTRLMADLTAATRWVSLSEGGAGNAAGAASVLAWQTGGPLAVNLAHNGPDYSPREWTTERVLERSELDAAVCIAADLPSDFSERLANTPTVAFDWRDTQLMQQADVSIRVARPGVECRGTTYRVDGVALPMRVAVDSQQPTAESVLKRIVGQLKLDVE